MKTRSISSIAFAMYILLAACEQNDETATAEQKNTEGKSLSAKEQYEDKLMKQNASKKTVIGGVTWYEDWNGGIAEAKKAQKPVYVHFTASWCVWCRRMEKETYSDPEISKRFSSDWITIKIDTEARNKTGTFYIDESAKTILVYIKGEQGSFQEKTVPYKPLMNYFGGKGLPTLLFIDKRGKPIYPISSYVPKDQFGPILDYFRDEMYEKKIKLDDYIKSHS